MLAQSQAKRRTNQATDKPAKRTRVSRACDQCRIARERCDGTQPTCSTCSTSTRTCTYTANVKKRGIQPGYIRALELALAFLFQHDPENESLVNDKLAQGGSSSLLLSRDSKESNKLHKRWRKARFYTDVDKILSGGEPPRHDQSEPLSPDSDEESEPEAPILGATISSQNLDHGKIQLSPSRQPQEQTSAPLQQLAATQTHVSLPLDSWRLFEVYFTYTQCWFPICEKHDILKLSYSYPADGLELSPELSESGSYAELWSVLAVASVHGTDHQGFGSQHQQSSFTPGQLYAIARSLIPNEVGFFELGHVKALLNLAIFNITQSLTRAAWVLVGYASRIMEAMEQSMLVVDPRRKHVLQGCFLLDSMLAIHLGRQSYFQKSDMDQLGKINDDGLEEWQPWNGMNSTSVQQPRTPLLALSMFNALLDITDILSSSEQPSQDRTQRLETWKRSLPPKLDCVCSETAATPLTPPTVLCQLAYYCTALTLTSSRSWLMQSLNLLERAQDQVGSKCLPPITRYLVGFIARTSSMLMVDRTVQHRLQKIEAALNEAWPRKSPELQLRAHKLPTVQLVQSTSALQLPTPLSTTQTIDQPVMGGNPHIALSPLDPALSSAHSTATPTQPASTFQNTPMNIQMDPRYPDVSGELESFFDELASLDHSNSVDNQPQFMQNLGFAPDANMADLFSEYIPLQSSTFLSQEDAGTTNLDHFGFYDAR